MSGEIAQRIEDIIAAHNVVLFMKGTRSSPQCGFSAQVVQILHDNGVDFHTVDILADWDIREGIKEFSNWPTIPQLYIQKEFIGGCDIVSQLQRDGKLQSLFQKTS